MRLGIFEVGGSTEARPPARPPRYQGSRCDGRSGRRRTCPPIGPPLRGAGGAAAGGARQLHLSRDRIGESRRDARRSLLRRLPRVELERTWRWPTGHAGGVVPPPGNAGRSPDPPVPVRAGVDPEHRALRRVRGLPHQALGGRPRDERLRRPLHLVWPGVRRALRPLHHHGAPGLVGDGLGRLRPRRRRRLTSVSTILRSAVAPEHDRELGGVRRRGGADQRLDRRTHGGRKDRDDLPSLGCPIVEAPFEVVGALLVAVPRHDFDSVGHPSSMAALEEPAREVTLEPWPRLEFPDGTVRELGPTETVSKVTETIRLAMDHGIAAKLTLADGGTLLLNGRALTYVKVV